MKLLKPLKGRVKLNEPLGKHTTFGVGGAADFFIQPKDEPDLKLLLSLLKRGKMPFLLIGAGSNLLVSDRGVRAAVISLDSPYFKRIICRGPVLEAGSGASLSRVIQTTIRNGLSGLEFLAGIPGTMGGALAMNAGISKRSPDGIVRYYNIADPIKDVTVMDRRGNVKTLQKKQIRFSYRKSGLAEYVILSARFKLIKKSKNEIKNKIESYINYRKATQDTSWRSAGCVFKNPVHDSAGRLIDLCGLKGKSIGDARVSSAHANFIINAGRAKAADILKLMTLIRKKVKAKFNIKLEPEIKIW
jgi:UDP-N-acetylmuramate dehydrogenase